VSLLSPCNPGHQEAECRRKDSECRLSHESSFPYRESNWKRGVCIQGILG
jgi:hypothetical protein